jgi:uncharacterized LabA/DUF88 family protein
MIPTDNRLKIAVFIDFDNVEIGVKNTIGGQFDIGLILDAIKERGEIVTKVAYSDWKRPGDYSRILTQHAIRLVQRNMTPGGDKNGADITMALDALEMAFTHAHINAFVIVGGDSDFISLVEKLKQYDRKVFVVGGRQFTSQTMQKNCHEFIAYENLVGSSRGPRRGGRGARPATANANISPVLPLIKRALKVLSDREVAPQLGLLKSTLLQLDSTFSEREYGAGSFRDFMEKVAAAGAVTLKESGRSVLVEARDDVHQEDAEAAERPSKAAPPERQAAPAPQADVEDVEPDVVPPSQTMDGVRAVQEALAGATPRWPMYVRQLKQVLKNGINGFDERKYGFASLVDLARAAQKAGVLRIERDRQGVMRVFPGTLLKTPSPIDATTDAYSPADIAAAEAAIVAAEAIDEPVAEPPIIDAETVEEPVTDVEDVKPGRRRATKGGSTKRAKASPAKARTRRPAKSKVPAA